VPPVPWSRLLAGALAVHIAWGLARVPVKVIARRHEDIAAHERAGATRAQFAANGCDGAEAVEWLQAHTAPDAVVAWTGTTKGAMELAAALLWPRLLVAATDLGDAPRWHGRPIAHGTWQGRDGRLVLVGTDAAVGSTRSVVHLEAR
jgi:hypothetical protein